jgi:acyl-CoA synthetase (AMP-forming)/AMP-acid ligase II
MRRRRPGRGCHGQRTPNTGHRTPDTGHLQAEASEWLSVYKVPTRWLVVPELPTLASGKPDRGRIAREVRSGELAASR